jgi:hypothetical protein
LDGLVQSNGEAGKYDFFTGCGGAGGSVWVSAGALAGNGAVRANGGSGDAGGGGGRIAVYYGDSSFAGAYSVNGGASGIPGQPGTIVARANIAPTGLVLGNATVVEGLPAGTLVGTFTSTDPDVGDSFAYTLVSGDGSADNAAFAIVGDELRTAAVFDIETKRNN